MNTKEEIIDMNKYITPEERELLINEIGIEKYIDMINAKSVSHAEYIVLEYGMDIESYGTVAEWWSFDKHGLKDYLIKTDMSEIVRIIKL